MSIRIPSSKILEAARTKIGCKYVLGAKVDATNAAWPGPFDCAEFTKWAVFQATGCLYGTSNDSAKTLAEVAQADGYTGHYAKKAQAVGKIVSVETACRVRGALILRVPGGSGTGGHIVISDGNGGTVEAMGSDYGVLAAKASNRRWDYGILPVLVNPAGVGVDVAWETGSAVVFEPPRWGSILRVGSEGKEVLALQKALNKLSASGLVLIPNAPLDEDGDFGGETRKAVVAFQKHVGIEVDGEVGDDTRGKLKTLGVL